MLKKRVAMGIMAGLLACSFIAGCGGGSLVRIALRNYNKVIEASLCLFNTFGFAIEIVESHSLIGIENASGAVGRNLSITGHRINIIVQHAQTIFIPLHLNKSVLNVGINHISADNSHSHTLAISIFQMQIRIIFQSKELKCINADLNILIRQILQISSNRFRFRRLAGAFVC